MRLRRLNLLWKSVAAAPAPAPSSSVTVVSTNSATEGSSVVHTVTLSGVTTVPQAFSISLGGGSATGGVDYTSSLTNSNFSSGVTISGSTITVPTGVSSFTVTVVTTADVTDEAHETYTLTVGGISGTGTINDDDDAGAGGDWEDDVPAPAGPASFTADWGEPIGDVDGWLVVYGPAQLSQNAIYTDFPYRKYTAIGSDRSMVISGVAAGTYYWRVAPIENGIVGDFSQDTVETAE